MSIRVVIGEDADLTILGAQIILERDGRFKVVGTARGLDELIDTVHRCEPDVVLLTEWFQNVDILTAITRLRRTSPSSKLIVMGMRADGLLIRDLFNLGAQGYLYKCDDLCLSLPLAVASVVQNRVYLSPTANSEYLVALEQGGKDWHLNLELRAVLRMMTQGATTHEIAEQLDISLRRVYWVQQKLRNRFGAATNAQLITRAVESGFVIPVAR